MLFLIRVDIPHSLGTQDILILSKHTYILLLMKFYGLWLLCTLLNIVNTLISISFKSTSIYLWYIWIVSNYGIMGINKTTLESYNDPRPSTKESISLKSGLTLWSVGFVCTDGRTPSLEIMNHFSSLCFGLCLGGDHFEFVCSDLLKYMMLMIMTMKYEIYIGSILLVDYRF